MEDNSMKCNTVKGFTSGRLESLTGKDLERIYNNF